MGSYIDDGILDAIVVGGGLEVVTSFETYEN
jgi:hypothetical protein